jgi:DNA polymerase-4
MSPFESTAIRRIAHLDMDAFYASVELLRYPQLRGQPVVIGGSRRRPAAADGEQFERLRDYVGRGVVTTATYPAREFGVHSAMGLMKAAQLCPQAWLLPVDFEQYRRYSRQFKSVIARFTPVIEDRGVDEVYIDFSQAEGGEHDGGRTLALRIQRAIHEDTGLTCSIGVASNKLLAKMASEFRKPNGVSIVYDSELIEKIWPLPCRKINGIGPKAGAQLEQFGPNHGGWMHDCAWGRDDREVVTQSEPVSMSRETTFERDLHAVRDRAELGAVFTDLCQRVAQDLQRHAYVGRTIGIKLRYDNFQRATREQTLTFYTSDASLIRRTAGLCLKRAPLERRLRLLGVKVAGLVKSDSAQALTPPPAQLPAPMPLF